MQPKTHSLIKDIAADGGVYHEEQTPPIGATSFAVRHNLPAMTGVEDELPQYFSLPHFLFNRPRASLRTLAHDIAKKSKPNEAVVDTVLRYVNEHPNTPKVDYNDIHDLMREGSESSTIATNKFKSPSNLANIHALLQRGKTALRTRGRFDKYVADRKRRFLKQRAQKLLQLLENRPGVYFVNKKILEKVQQSLLRHVLSKRETEEMMKKSRKAL